MQLRSSATMALLLLGKEQKLCGRNAMVFTLTSPAAAPAAAVPPPPAPAAADLAAPALAAAPPAPAPAAAPPAPAPAAAPPAPALAAPPPPSARPSDRYNVFRSLYPTFDATVEHFGGHVDLALSFLQGVLSAREADTEVSTRRVLGFPPAVNVGAPAVPPPPAPAAPAPAAPALAAAAPPPPLDAACPGLQPPRGDDGVRELDVCACDPSHLWHLFLNASINGGYLGKSVIHFLVQGTPAFAAAYPGGKFNKSSPNLEAQKLAFLAHCSDATRLQAVHDFIMNKIPNLSSLRSKMRCVNVPNRLAAAAEVARAAAVAAAVEPPKAIMDDNLYCRPVQFVKFSGVHPPLADLFNRYYGNEHSRSRHAADTDGFRCVFTMCFQHASSPSPLQDQRYSPTNGGHVQHLPSIFRFRGFGRHAHCCHARCSFLAESFGSSCSRSRCR